MPLKAWILVIALMTNAQAHAYDNLKDLQSSQGKGKETWLTGNFFVLTSDFSFQGYKNEFELRTSAVFSSPDLEFVYGTNREQDASAVGYAGVRNGAGYLAIYYLYGNQPAFVKLASSQGSATCFPFRDLDPLKAGVTPEYFRLGNEFVRTQVRRLHAGHAVNVTLSVGDGAAAKKYSCDVWLGNLDSPFEKWTGHYELFVGGNKSSSLFPTTWISDLTERATRVLVK